MHWERLGPLKFAFNPALRVDFDLYDNKDIVYRSTEPILMPEVDEERVGIVPNVVFPTGIDQREDGRVDVYYGMADSQIGVARLDLPAQPVRRDAAEPQEELRG